jgi:predicted transcriptional regulator
MQIDSKTAKILGLHKDEVLVLEKLDGATLKIAELSQETKIPRTSLYYMLSRLEDRGFVHQVKQGKKILWTKSKDIMSTHKKALSALLDKEEANILTSLISKETKVSVLRDKKIIQIFEDISNLAPRTRIYGVQPDTSFVQAVEYIPLTDLIKINNTIKQKNIIVEAIIHERSIDSIQNLFNKDDLRVFLESFGGRSADTVKLPFDYLKTTSSEIYLYNNTVALINWKEKFAVTIQNEDVFELALEMFKSTKYMLSKYDQNEKIARKLVDLA